MLWILANDAHDALAVNNLAFVTHFLLMVELSSFLPCVIYSDM